MLQEAKLRAGPPPKTLTNEPTTVFKKRDESTPEKLPKMFYCKLPPGISGMEVLLVDPMLATGEALACFHVFSCASTVHSRTSALTWLRVLRLELQVGLVKWRSHH